MKNPIFVIFFLLIFNKLYSSDIVNYGVVDVRGKSFNQLILSGIWEYYPGRLVSPSEFKDTSRLAGAKYVIVPSFQPKSPSGEKFPHKGVATYRVKIFLDSTQSIYLFRSPFGLTAQRIYINGHKICEIGKVGYKEDFEPKAGMWLYFIDLHEVGKKFGNSLYLDIVIQVANYASVNMGMKYPPILIYRKGVASWIFIQSIINVFALSIILFVAWLYLIYGFVRKQKKKMYFAFVVFALLVFVRGLMENNVVLPPMNYDLFGKFSFGFPALYPAILTIFLYYAYSQVVNKFCVYITSAISGILFALILFTSPEIYTHTMKFLGVYIFVVITCLTVLFLIDYIKHPKKRILWTVIGLGILFITNLNDSLHATQVIRTLYISRFGLFLYIIFQMIGHGLEYEELYSINVQLTEKLRRYANELEQIIKDRTKIIEEQKAELEAINEELKMQNDEIRAQKDQIQMQNERLAKINESLNASIQYASNIQQAILPTEEEIGKYFEYFVIYMPREIVSGDLYVFMELPNIGRQKQFMAAVIDATGHGIPGAFMSLLSYMIVNKIIIEKQIYSPKEIIKEANKEIINILHQKGSLIADGFDIVITRIIELSGGEYRIISSGAKLALYYKNIGDKITTRIRGGRKGVGGYYSEEDLNMDFVTDYQLVLQKGAMIWLASDGFIDQVNDRGIKYGSRRFMQLLSDIAHLPVQEQRRILEEEFYKWKGDQVQRDDVTIFGIRL